jgi:hypothetical protein
MLDHTELEWGGKKVSATCRAFGVSTSGPAVPSNARWEITVDGVSRDGFPGSPDDTVESVRAEIVAWLVAREAHPVVPYQGFQIRPTPHELRDSNAWTLDIQIWKDQGSEVDAHLFSARNTFATREEAVLQGVQFGRRIIDGNVPGCSVAGL